MDRIESHKASRQRGVYVRTSTLILVAALFCVVVGGKLTVLHLFGSDLPYWDQWDGEANLLFLPFLQERLQWTDFLVPQNEHRMAPSKVLSLALLVANGQWDNRLESVVNGVLHALLAIALFLFGRSCIDRRMTPVWFAGLVAFIALPVAWQNVISGFQSAQILILIFAFAACVCLFRFRQGQLGWWAGLAIAAVSVITLGSGLFVPAVIAGMLALSDQLRVAARRHAIAIATCLLLCGIGYWTHLEVPHHERLKASTGAEFFWTVWRNLQWPVTGFVLFSVLAWAPWTWLTWQLVVRRRWRDPHVWALSATGGFVLLNYVAAGYARGAGGGWPPSRYMDTVAFGILVNLLALLIAFTRVRLSGWRRWSRIGLSVAGLVLLSHGLGREVAQIIRHELPGFAANMQKGEDNIRAYLLSGDHRDLMKGRIPYPSANGLAERLRHPEIRAILPVSVRAPLDLRGTSDPTGSFTHDRVPQPGREIAWSSFAQPSGKQGVWTSEVLPPAAGGFWQFRLAGTLDSDAVSLAITKQNHHLIATAPAQSMPLLGWTTLFVKAPSEPSRVLARDADPNSWIAFSGPRFMGAGSYWIWKLVSAGEYVFVAGLMIAWLGLFFDGAVRYGGAERAVHAMMLGAILTGGCAVALAWFLYLRNSRLPAASLELFARTAEPVTLQVFLDDGGDGFDPARFVETELEPSSEPWPSRLLLPGGRIRRLRLDPAFADTIVEVGGLRIVDAEGRPLHPFAFADLAPLHDIARLEPLGEWTRIVPETGSNDPSLELRLVEPLLTAYTGRHLWRAICLPAALVLVVGTCATGLVTLGINRRTNGRLSARSDNETHD